MTADEEFKILLDTAANYSAELAGKLAEVWERRKDTNLRVTEKLDEFFKLPFDDYLTLSHKQEELLQEIKEALNAVKLPYGKEETTR